ncbi:hypothetical protein BC567DRAFT_236973 [Phyllosticta citribraziliensis]
MHDISVFLPLFPVHAFISGIDTDMYTVDDMQLPDGLGACQDTWSAHTGSARSDVAPLRSR